MHSVLASPVDGIGEQAWFCSGIAALSTRGDEAPVEGLNSAA
ncbi:MAG: hypothetical protein RBU37_27510 [Myxococcota bacterium]|nr:hypothetical protein [Myxococcota bacterium]